MEAESKQKRRGKNIFLMGINDLVELPGLNVRLDYGDLDALENSIQMNGIQEPLKAYLDRATGKYVVVKGHRRYRASQNLHSKGIIFDIPVLMYTSVPTAEQILEDHITSNSGLPLSALEKAEVCRRYKDLGHKTQWISTRIGMTYQQAKNFLLLSEAPDSLKELISENWVKSTCVVEMFKDLKDFTQVEAMIKTHLLSTASKFTSTDYKNIKSPDVELEEAEERQPKASVEKTKKITLDQKIELFSDELKLFQDDSIPERTDKISLFLETIEMLKENNEPSVILNTLYS